MDYQEQERKILHNQSKQDQYLWIHKNQYHKIFHGFVHDQNLKVKMNLQNQNSLFKIQQRLSPTPSGKSYSLTGDFQTWNVLRLQNLEKPTKDHSFIQKIIQKPTVLFGISNNNIRLECRAGEKLYKGFAYNPFIALEAAKDLQNYIVSMGLIHRSRSLYLFSRFSALYEHSLDFKARSRVEYVKNQIFLGLVSQFGHGIYCRVNKGLLGYQLSPNDYFYLRFQTDNFGELIKGKPVNQQIAFYYLRKFKDHIKCALGVKSINSIENTLNLIVETKVPFHIKVKLDTKFNIFATFKKEINDYSSISYGIGLSELFKKKFRIQTGLVYEYNG